MKKQSALVFFLVICGVCAAQQSSGVEAIHAKCPLMHPESDAPPSAPAPDPGMLDRGEQAMGFSQTATVHHFLLTLEGGVIQVETRDTSDTDDLASVRKHLHHIAGAFQQGDFDIPMFVHDTVPPGEPEMKQLQKEIHYSFEATAKGGRIIIRTDNKAAIAAVHRFLIFQIEEHKTGDPTVIRWDIRIPAR